MNDFFYKQRSWVMPFANWLSYANGLFVLGVLFYGYGFVRNLAFDSSFFRLLEVSFLIYTLQYTLRWFFDTQPKDFLAATWFQAVLAGLFLLRHIIYLVWHKGAITMAFMQMHIATQAHIYAAVTTALGLMIVFFQLTRISLSLGSLKIKPAILFVLSFLLLIVKGTILLMLPAMTQSGDGLGLVDAFFTSTSATCVTGLSVVSTTDFFSIRGQLVIMVLMQFGGIGIVSFATFFATLSRGGVGFKQQSLIQNVLSAESLESSKNLLKQIVVLTFSIEAIGAFLIYNAWGLEASFNSIGQKIYYSIFHSISAFCNAGFSLFNNSLYEQPLRHAHLLHAIIMVLIVLGGLGFGVFNDLFSPKILRERLKKPWLDWRTPTKIVLYTTLSLTVIGAVGFYFIENQKLLGSLSFFEQMLASIFQSVTARTAGFNTVDISAISEGGLVLLMFLMFIGASPSSTGGGIKTTTFFLVTSSWLASIRGHKRVEVFKRTIPNDLIFKAFTVFGFAVAFNFVATFVLVLLESDFQFIDLMFEQISAYATVGLSTGITSSLSAAGKLVISVSMFIGRVGSLTLAFAISQRVVSTNYKYPDVHIMIG